MKLTELLKASNLKKPNHSILLYGPPKTGKTRLVGTAAKIKELDRIYWIDLENGSETLLHMGLTEEEMGKIELIRIPDTRETPRGCETVLKMFSSKEDIRICSLHGKVNCVECKTNKEEGETIFNLRKCTHKDLVIIDSGSQLGDSSLAMACLGKSGDYKPGWDEYGLSNKWLGDILSVIQQATFTNFVVITHEMIIEEEINGIKRDKIIPLMGTRAFCGKVAKYFGTVVYTELKLGKHAAGSSSTYKANHITGSRVNVKIENAKEPTMRAILIEGGILKEEN
jgi:hypothetical protein